MQEAYFEEKKKASEVLPTTLQSPEWPGAEISGEGTTTASSSIGPLGAPMAERAAVPEPTLKEDIPD